jgi:hypothetical protein
MRTKKQIIELNKVEKLTRNNLIKAQIKCRIEIKIINSNRIPSPLLVPFLSSVFGEENKQTLLRKKNSLNFLFLLISSQPQQ